MSQDQVVTYPTPIYSNPPINPQFYIPNKFFIQGITMGVTTVVTTTVDHNYVIGQIVRLLIPKIFTTVGSIPTQVRGIQIPTCTQLNGKEATVVSIPSSTQVELDIDSLDVDAFITSSQPTQPQIVATGDYNSGYINAFGRVNTGTFIPGSFINISPL